MHASYYKLRASPCKCVSTLETFAAPHVLGTLQSFSHGVPDATPAHTIQVGLSQNISA